MWIPDHVNEAILRLEEGGYQAFLVGGCVRDAALGVPVKDWDLATSATVELIRKVFAGLRTLDTGIAHGTLTVLYDEGPLEITTFRKDGAYLDHRHPKKVTYVATIEEDLSRRDFTMNAIAYNPKTGFVDPFDGMKDLKSGFICCVGDADARLREDALRIMRVLRFSATLGFAIDAKLEASLRKNRELLTRIAPERISVELSKMLVGENIQEVLLGYPDVLGVIIPEIAVTEGFEQRSVYHRYDVWEHTVRAVAAGKPDPLIRLALLLHDLGKPAKFIVDEEGRGHFYGHNVLGEEIARKRLKELRFSSAVIEKVSTGIHYHLIKLHPGSTQKWLARLGEEMLRFVIEIRRGDMAAHADRFVEEALYDLDASEEKLDELIEEGACYRLKDLAINGEDLLELGMEEGRQIGEVLAELLDKVIEGKLENTRNELLKAATHLKKSHNPK